MSYLYKSLEELSRDFTDGESCTHRSSPHTPDECIGWQHGVEEFAKWVDAATDIEVHQDSDLIEWRCRPDKSENEKLRARVKELEGLINTGRVET